MGIILRVLEHRGEARMLWQGEQARMCWQRECDPQQRGGDVHRRGTWKAETLEEGPHLRLVGEPGDGVL